MKTIDEIKKIESKKYEIKKYYKVIKKEYKPLRLELNNKDENHL